MAEKLKKRDEIERLNSFTYDDDALADTVHETLVEQSFAFEGLTVSTLLLMHGVWPPYVIACGVCL